MIEGKAELSPDENSEKFVYFDSRNNFVSEKGDLDEDSVSGSENTHKIKKWKEINEMEEYLKKKRLLCNKIGKLKFVRYYMDKPEMKKRRRRERKKKEKIAKEIEELKEVNGVKTSENTITLNVTELNLPQNPVPSLQITENAPIISRSPSVPLVNSGNNPIDGLIEPPTLIQNQSDQVPPSIGNLPNTIENPFVSSSIDFPRTISEPISLPISSPKFISTPNFQFSTFHPQHVDKSGIVVNQQFFPSQDINIEHNFFEGDM